MRNERIKDKTSCGLPDFQNEMIRYGKSVYRNLIFPTQMRHSLNGGTHISVNMIILTRCLIRRKNLQRRIRL